MVTSSVRCLTKCSLALLLLALLLPAGAQEAATEAVLAKELNADRLDAGSAFTLKVRSPWEQGDCRLAPGMLLHATVKSVTRAPNGHVHEISFVLGAPCGDKKPLDLVVTSLLAPPKVETVAEEFPSYNSSGVGGGAQLRAAPLNANPAGAMRSAPGNFSSATIKTNQLPTTATLGEVWHLPKVKLIVPSGSSVVSTVGTTGRSLQLPEETVVILQRARPQAQGVRTVSVAASRPAGEAPRSVHPFVSACRAGSCRSYGAALMTSGFGFRQLGSDEELTKLGFRAEHDREVAELEPSATIHFLSDAEVLVTFPTHALVQRTGEERPTDDPRSIRAVLFNFKTRSVERVLDWVVENHSAYVWPYGQRLLVHDGRWLRVYGPGLEEVATLPLEMPLASLRSSPDGEHLLLGELHELHTAEEHRSLMETDKHGPQEEVLWSLLDGKLRRIRALGTSSNHLATPVLLNDSLVELRKGHDPEWFLVGRTWEGGAERQLGSLRSGCIPILGDIAPNLLTVGTCDVNGDGLHSFLARENGSPVMVQGSGDQDMPMAFVAASASPKVAVMQTRASEAYQRGLVFHLSVIQSQAVEVVGAEGGDIEARVPVPEAAPYREPFALSPDGATLALLYGHRLSFYAVGP